MNLTAVKLPVTWPQRRWRRWLSTWSQYALVSVFVLVFLQKSVLPPADYLDYQLGKQTGSVEFSLLSWEWKALLNKLAMEFAAPQDTLTQAQRYQLVTAYLETLSAVKKLESDLSGLYSRLDGQEAAEKAAPLREELADRRAWLKSNQNVVEGILEEQISAELEAEGFGRWGYVWPPVKIRFTELPLVLIVSTRAQISRKADINLKAGLSLSEQEMLEETVDSTFGAMRSLVTPIGGLSTYPAMILEHDSLVWLTDTFAHEWAHHFLILYPLGYNYNQSGEMTSINETTASIVGREIGRRVILRYYPELRDGLPPLPAPPETPPMSAGELIWPDEPPPDQFDLTREMRKTRLRVDELLAEGRIEDAEAYMEERRQFLVEHGYGIRKLNQAYFAFHGSYATNPSSANPIGGQLEWLRAQRPTLRDYLRTVAGVSQPEDLIDLLRAP